MNLIDLDDLKKKEVCISCGTGKGLLFHGVTAATIDAMPTIEARPVVHGRWSWCAGNKYRCTNCGRHTNVDEVMEEPVYNYCPYCGAKMDGGEDNG